jgi:hypothetical protein
MHAAVESLRETAIQVRTVAHEPTGVRPYVTNRPELSVNRGIWLGSATETRHFGISIRATRTPGVQFLTSLTWCSASVISGGASSKSPRGRARIFSQKGERASVRRASGPRDPADKLFRWAARLLPHCFVRYRTEWAP